MEYVMKKIMSISLSCCLMVVLLAGIALGRDDAVQKINWLQGLAFKYEKMKDKAIVQIKRAEATISKCGSIIKIAREKGNKEAERVARNALATAGETKRISQKNKLIAEMSISHLRHLMTSLSENDLQGLLYVVAGYVGDVQYYSANDSRVYPLTSISRRQPQPGDTILTGKNSRAQIYMFDRHGTQSDVTLGEYSRLHLEKDESKLSQFENLKLTLMKGCLHLQEKMDKRVGRKHNKRAALTEEWEDCAQKYGLNSLACRAYFSRIKNTIWTPSGTCSIRGTEFVAFEGEKTGLRIVVLSGRVIVSNKKQDEIKIVEPGFGVNVSRQGKISKPKKIDASGVTRWWAE